MSNDERERRMAERYDFPSTIEFDAGTKSGENNQKAVTINISKSGLCLYLFESFIRHQEIRIKSILPIISKKARIRWIKKIDEGFFKAGVSFM
ncbi:MAG: PilZ domain-containing protein [Thermodesulfovibrionales bacterium]